MQRKKKPRAIGARREDMMQAAQRHLEAEEGPGQDF